MIKSECEPTAANLSNQLICGHVPIPIRQKIYFLFMFFRKRLNTVYRFAILELATLNFG